MSSTSRQDQLSQQSSFVFKGTVKKLKAATMKSVTVTNQTAVVHVDQIQQAPKILSSYAGQDITVQLSQGSKLKEGAQAIFYTNEWLFGDSIAVRENGHTDVGTRAAARASRATASPSSEDRTLKDHLGDADIVVSGRVLSVGLPKPSNVRGGRAKLGPGALTEPVSEHSAKWNEAIVEVQTVEKGREAHKQIVVRFPRSSDVAWAKAPKLEPGQEGLFLLHKADVEATSPLRGAGAKKKQSLQSYVVLHAHDFMPTDQSEEVKALIPNRSRRDSNKKR